MSDKKMRPRMAAKSDNANWLQIVVEKAVKEVATWPSWRRNSLSDSQEVVLGGLGTSDQGRPSPPQQTEADMPDLKQINIYTSEGKVKRRVGYTEATKPKTIELTVETDAGHVVLGTFTFSDALRDSTEWSNEIRKRLWKNRADA
jgi:hypothetical protein